MKAQVPENEKFTMPTGIYLLHKSKEVMTMIMAHLNVKDTCSAAQVCKEWRSAANHPRVWKTSNVVINLLTPPSPHLIQTMAWRRLDNLTLDNLADANQLRDIVHGIPSLEALAIERSPEATDQMLVDAFSSTAEALIDLKLSDCSGLTDITVQQLADHQVQLTGLYISNCHGLTDKSLQLISMSMVHLVFLDLFQCDGITDSGIEQLCSKDSKCRKLRYFQMSSCKQLTNLSCKHVAEAQRSMVSFAFSPSELMTVASMVNLSRSTFLLEVMLLDKRIDDEWLVPLTTGNWRLRVLLLRNCDRVTDQGLGRIAKLPVLYKLTLRYCHNIEDNGLRYLTNADSKISQLQIKDCRGITDEGMKNVGKIPRLRKLKLSTCKHITSVGINNLAEGQSNLESIIVDKCENVGQSAFRVIASGLFKVRYLDLQEGQLSEQGMILAARTLPNLQSVLAGGNEFVGDIRHLRRTGPQS